MDFTHIFYAMGIFNSIQGRMAIRTSYLLLKIVIDSTKRGTDAELQSIAQSDQRIGWFT